MTGEPDEGYGEVMDDRVVRRVWIRVTRGWEEWTLEIADRVNKESEAMRNMRLRKRGREDFLQALKNGLKFDCSDRNGITMAGSKIISSLQPITNSFSTNPIIQSVFLSLITINSFEHCFCTAVTRYHLNFPEVILKRTRGIVFHRRTI